MGKEAPALRYSASLNINLCSELTGPVPVNKGNIPLEFTGPASVACMD